ncbi:4Fe-4S binding protein [Desulfosporosinus burensis]
MYKSLQKPYNQYTPPTRDWLYLKKEWSILMKQIWMRYSYLFTILFFTIGFFNIIFAWIGFFCLIMPFVFVIKDNKRTWCQSNCPRSNLFTRLFAKIGAHRQPPKWLINGTGKKVMLTYFLLNFLMICLSTLMVFLDIRDPLEKIRFLMAFQLPWNMPNLLSIGAIPDWAVHLGYRVYSMMFTTTIIGLLLSYIYRARTWCAICPMGTLSGLAVRKPNTLVTNEHVAK